VGHRGARESEWSWEHTEEISERRISRRPLRAVLITLGIVGGLAAFAFGIFLIASNGDGDAAPPVVSASASPTPAVTPDRSPVPTDARTPTPARTETPTPSATAAPTATPGPSYDVEFAAWSRTESQWLTPSHNDSTSDYEEGEAVPFILRIDNAEPGETYSIAIEYDCLAAGNHAFDYLGGAEDAGAEPLLADPGPGGAVHDSSLVVPDDTSIDFDDPNGGSLKAWGGVFSSARAPDPQTPCTGAKTVNLSLLAQGRTVILVWTGHLASPSDWGNGRGAGDATPFGITVVVDDVIERTFTMLAGSVEG
jgi:hypothetical protein